MSRLNNGRLAAGRSLIAIERGAHAEDILPTLAPAGVDRALAWHITYGVLRRQGSLDAALRPFLRKSISRLDPSVRVALRVGLLEGALSRTPVHAAVDQAVELVRKLGSPRASGLVNAVLRRAIPAPIPDDPFCDLPPWLAKRWADCPEWVRRLREPARICVATVDGQPPDGLTTTPAHAISEEVCGAYWVDGQSGAVENWAGFDSGRWWVMDPAAAAVADLCGAAPGMRILDACAAPGGKSFRMMAAGAEVLAVDLEPARLERLKEGAARLSMPVRVAVHDWLTGPMPGGETFSVVLVDAPCTGLGVVRRRPEIRWRRLPSDPAAMVLRQRPILQAAAAHVAPGGRLVYAVCSPMVEEGEGAVAALDGWQIERRWSSAPPAGDEDAFQAIVLRRA